MRGLLSMGMVIIQPCILVSKLKKIKKRFLHYTGYLNSTKHPIKQNILLIPVLVWLHNFLNCNHHCLTAVVKM